MAQAWKPARLAAAGPLPTTYTLSLDSISEFVVHSSSYSAKYGRALGGVIEAVTKSGENSPYGNVFYCFRNDISNANTIQANAAGLSRPELRFNQYGANSGGPLLFRMSERYGRVGVEGSLFPISQLHFKQPGQPLFDRDLTSFGPRFGFAYRIGDSEKTVIRGGAGIFIGNNYPGLLTIAASAYIPPMIRASLYSFGYTRSITFFTPATAQVLAFPDTSFISPSQLLATLAKPNSGPAPIFVAPDWRNTSAYQWNFSIERTITQNSSSISPMSVHGLST